MRRLYYNGLTDFKVCEEAEVLKRPLLFSSVLCLVLGVLCGTLIPTPWGQADKAVQTVQATPLEPDTASTPIKAGAPSNSGVSAAEALDPSDNVRLLSAAFQVVNALKTQDYKALSEWADPQLGVTFTPYSSVNPETDNKLSASDLKHLASDDTVYTWGFTDGRGSLIEMTISQYLSTYVFNVDYSRAPQIGIDTVLITGNALENVAEAYPGCRFVDFCYPSIDPANEGFDWCSLKLVFQPGSTSWSLVGVIHGQWTI